MQYSNCAGNCKGSYSPGGLGSVVNKFYVNGDVNVHNINNGIVHSIAAERMGDVHVYSQTIDNRIGHVGPQYVINLDNRKVEFIPPYQTSGREIKYDAKRSGYLLPAPENTTYSTGSREYQGSITVGLLNTCRPVTQFINQSAEVEHLVRETFETLTGQPFPDDIEVRVLGEEEMRKAHGAGWHPGIMGFAINRPGMRKVFVRKNHLDALMLTMGHEIGHVLTAQLPDALNEEAKAFAFELAWVRCIVENDIGRLAGNFNVNFVPASNGLHDRAFAFVQKMVQKGKDAMGVFRGLVCGSIQTSQRD